MRMTMRKVMMGILAAAWFTVAASGAAWCGDNGNGTVTVNGLVYLKDAGCLQWMDWDSATERARTLANGQYGLTDGSQAGAWRLPTIEELKTVYSAKSQFKNVQPDEYWSSTSYEGVSILFWYIRMSNGAVSYGPKAGSFNVWPVRSIH